MVIASAFSHLANVSGPVSGLVMLRNKPSKKINSGLTDLSVGYREVRFIPSTSLKSDYHDVSEMEQEAVN